MCRYCLFWKICFFSLWYLVQYGVYSSRSSTFAVILFPKGLKIIFCKIWRTWKFYAILHSLQCAIILVLCCLFLTSVSIKDTTLSSKYDECSNLHEVSMQLQVICCCCCCFYSYNKQILSQLFSKISVLFFVVVLFLSDFFHFKRFKKYSGKEDSIDL